MGLHVHIEAVCDQGDCRERIYVHRTSTRAARAAIRAAGFRQDARGVACAGCWTEPVRPPWEETP